MANNQSSAGGYYDSAETIDYQLRQLPTESTLSRLAWEWKQTFPDLPTPAVKRGDRQSTRGLTNVLSWVINRDATLNRAFVDYAEFGYDERGCVCKLQGGGHGNEHASNFVPRHEINEHMVSNISVHI